MSLAVCLMTTILSSTACEIFGSSPRECSSKDLAPQTSGTGMTYLFALEQIPDDVLKAGTSVDVWWLSVTCPRTRSQDDEAPASVWISIGLYGPYQTQDAAAHALADIPSYPAKPSDKPVATNTPFVLSDTAGWRLSETLKLPPTLQPGYYVVLGETSRAIDSSWCRTTFLTHVSA
jgi:hypothetical protein